MKNVIKQIEDYVQKILKNDFGGHGWYHTNRVRNIATKIQKEESGNKFLIEVSSLLHEVLDKKIDGQKLRDTKSFIEFLQNLKISKQDISQIFYIIDNMSFSKRLDKNYKLKTNKELEVVFDADKVEPIGALGIARAFSHGGHVSTPIYDPEILSNKNIDLKEYRNKNRKTTSFNHIDEKILRMNKMLYTKTGRKLAKDGVKFVENYQKQFLKEWDL